MKRYWLSWYEHSEDNRPLTDPPNEQILGWWETGFGDDYYTMVALVEAESEEAAWAAVEKDWPKASENANRRFCEERDKTFTIVSDRFPLKDWAKKRMGL